VNIYQSINYHFDQLRTAGAAKYVTEVFNQQLVESQQLINAKQMLFKGDVPTSKSILLVCIHFCSRAFF
jgi:hypothetical protein